jgi:hypothetical protein
VVATLRSTVCRYFSKRKPVSRKEAKFKYKGAKQHSTLRLCYHSPPCVKNFRGFTNRSRVEIQKCKANFHFAPSAIFAPLRENFFTLRLWYITFLCVNNFLALRYLYRGVDESTEVPAK